MSNKPRSDLESQLEWYYVSTQTLVRILIGVVVLGGLLTAGVFFFLKRDESAGRAKTAIAEAEDALSRARQQKDAALFGKEIASAEDMLLDARKDLAASLNEKAARTAVEVKSRALKILAGAGVKSNATVVDTAGDVKIQKANRNTWDSLRTNTGLGEGDFIKTGPNGTAEVLWNDGTMYRIRPETLFEVHGAAGGPSGNVKLVVGTTEVNTGEKSNASVSTDVAVARIGVNASVGMETDARHTNVSSFAGSTTLTDRTGNATTLGPRERAAASKEGGIGPKTTLPESPDLTSPDDNLEIDFKKREPLRLRWSPVKDASAYELEIARSRLFVKDSILDIGASERAKPDVLIDITEPGSYFWHVRSIRKGSPPAFSEWTVSRRFKVSSGEISQARLDTLPPDLVITQRPNVVGSSVVLVGRAAPGASVTVNGEIADVAADGSSKKIISMPGDGLQTIVIKAKSAGGETIKRESVLINSN
jgi:type II secretory pathway pseudopilin PulG